MSVYTEKLELLPGRLDNNTAQEVTNQLVNNVKRDVRHLDPSAVRSGGRDDLPSLTSTVMFLNCA